MHTILEKHIVLGIDKAIRASDYLVEKFEIISTRKGIKKAISKNRILCNGKIVRSGYFVKQGDLFELLESTEKPPKVFEMEIPVHYEDDYLAIVEKPAGIPVSGNKYKTLVNTLAYNLTTSKQKDKLEYFKPIHRLDVATSGLVIVAKTTKARVLLGKMLEEKTIQKVYHAIVQGKIIAHGTLNSSISEKQCVSTFKTLSNHTSKHNAYLSLLELSPISGRTHQLRIHLSRLGYPIVGDKLYGVEGNIMKHKGLFLAAIQVKFCHPITQDQVFVQIKHPEKFNSFLKREERNT